MSNEENEWKNCYEFDNLTWINYQFIQFIKKDDHFELQINLEGLESLAQNISKLSRTRKNRILYLGNCNWGNGKFVCYTPFWYLDHGSIKVTLLKLLGNEEILRADYGESESEELGKQKEIYLEGTKKGLEKLIKALSNTRDGTQQIAIDSVSNDEPKFILNTFLVNYKGRKH